MVAHYAESLPFGGEHHGLPAYLSALAELNRLFRLDVVGDEVVSAGNRVLLLLNVVYTAPSTGRSTRQSSVEILTFTGTEVTDVAVYYRDTAALLAALAAR